jgi:hypothetical protein
MQQTMLTIGALIILGTVIVGVNSTISNQQLWSIGSESIITGTAIGQALIEQITVKRYDEGWYSPLICTDPQDLVVSDSLCPDPGESAEIYFDDIDDYNGFKKTVTTDRLGNFYLTCKVFYVDSITFQKTTSKSFYKQIDVMVQNIYIPTEDSTTIISTISGYRPR